MPFGPSAMPFGPSVMPFGPSVIPFGPSVMPFGPSAMPFGPSVMPFGPSGMPFGGYVEALEHRVIRESTVGNANGALRDTYVYSIIASEWRAVKAHLEALSLRDPA